MGRLVRILLTGRRKSGIIGGQVLRRQDNTEEEMSMQERIITLTDVEEAILVVMKVLIN